MGQTIGEIDLGLNINQMLFNKQISGLAKSAQVPITNAFKPIGKMIAGALAIGSITKFTKECLDLGSDLMEVQNVVDTTFKSLNGSVNEFAAKAMTSFGLSETVTKQYMGTLGAMSKSMGFSEQSAYNMASAVTGLAGDVASFYNLSTDEAFDKLKSIWTGETETLKSIGVLLTQTNLDQYALNNGFGKTTASMTEQEKVMLRYQYTMSALSDASGDFAKTSGSWANQIRILSLQFDSLKATLGQGFINLFTPIIQMINSLLSRLQVLAQQFKAFTEMLVGNRGSSESAVASLAADAADASAGFAGVESSAKKAAKAVGLLSMDELNVISSNTGTSDAGTGTSTTEISVINSATETTNGLIGDVNKNIEMLTQSIKPFTGAIKRLWSEGLSKFGNFSITSLKDFYNEFLKPLGKWAFGTEDKGLSRLADIINEDLCGVDWDTINKNLKEFWKAMKPYAEEFGEGLLDFFEDASDVAFDTLEKLCGGDGILVDLTDWLNNNDPSRAKSWGYALGRLSIALLTFRTMGPVIPVLSKLFGLLGKTSLATGISASISDALGSLGGISGLLTMDMATIFGAGTATEIGLTIGVGVAGGIISAIAGFELGKWLGKQLFPEDAEWYDNFKWLGEGGFFDEMFSTDLDTHIDAIAEMSKEFGGLFGVLDTLKEKASGTGLTFDDLFTGLGGSIQEAGPIFENWFKEKVSPWLSKEKWTKGMLGIEDSFKTTFKNACNVGIDIFNRFINCINEKMHFSWDSFSIAGKEIVPSGNLQLFSLPHIPKLAQGGYVGANQPQLAMIGDNKRYGEIVSPEDKMYEISMRATLDALKEVMASMPQQNDSEQGDIVIIIDGREVFRCTRKYAKEYYKTTGKPAFD